jgi:23S rRNA pseudouridine2604 synthase
VITDELFLRVGVHMKRINKYLSEAGYCSRREADRLIEANRVTINDQVPELGTKVEKGDIVKVDGKPISNKIKRIYLAFNKPVGVVSTTDTKEKNNIVDFIGYPSRLFHIGRLDKDSQGLILMTNDGDIVNKILRAENAHEKEYLVRVDKKITPSMLSSMEKGVTILDTVTKPCKTVQVDDYSFKIILTEGLNRQIRRMVSFFGYHVVSLKRIRIMHIDLDVPSGKYRHLSDGEMTKLEELLMDSKK